MAFALPNGSTVFVGSGLSNPVSVSAVSNAEGAIFTVAENHNLRAYPNRILFQTMKPQERCSIAS